MENNEIKVTLIVRGGTSAEWAAANPTPAMRELCAEYREDGSFDLKIGDGVTPYNSLPYVSTHELADLIEDANHRTVTDAEKAAWNAKQAALTFDNVPTADSNNPVTSGGVAAALAGKADTGDIPDVSQFITRAVNDLVNYYTSAVIDGKIADLNNAISAIPKFAIKVVDTLPSSDISTTTVYLLKTSTTETGNLYTEYIFVNSTWESLGTQTLDLSNYATKDYVATAIANFVTAAQVTEIVNGALASYAKLADIAAIGKSGNLSDAVQDANHRTVTDAEKAAWNAKQAALTFDTTPAAGSTNPVTSGGVKNALDGKADKTAVPSASTQLSDSADLMRYGDSVIINGGGV